MPASPVEVRRLFGDADRAGRLHSALSLDPAAIGHRGTLIREISSVSPVASRLET